MRIRLAGKVVVLTGASSGIGRAAALEFEHAGILINVSSVLAERPRRELYVPRGARLAIGLHRLFPKIGDRILLHVTREWHFGHQSQPTRAGNLYSPELESAQVRGHRPALTTFPRLLLWGAGHLVRGLWRKRSRRSSLRPHSSP